MNNFGNYRTLAEELFFGRMGEKGLLEVAKYRPGKTMEDLEEAMIRKLEGKGKGNPDFVSMARRVSEIVELDPKYNLSKMYADRANQ